jgi:hypothetical protein
MKCVLRGSLSLAPQDEGVEIGIHVGCAGTVVPELSSMPSTTILILRCEPEG